MRRAFDVWSKVTNLKFEEKTSGKAHIEIRYNTYIAIRCSTSRSGAVHRDQVQCIEIRCSTSKSGAVHRDQVQYIEIRYSTKRSGAVHRDQVQYIEIRYSPTSSGTVHRVQVQYIETRYSTLRSGTVITSRLGTAHMLQRSGTVQGGVIFERKLGHLASAQLSQNPNSKISL